ncbi:MAG: hypothetical protein IT269_11135, partial [Saprospiraceae bacterium]|nr:hypothetical protein [Saprospiraceae bacterium]
MQIPLFEIEPQRNKTASGTLNGSNDGLSRGYGAKDASSRYVKLKQNLDNDKIYNGNWFEVDTQKVKDAKSAFNFVDLFSGA